MSKNENRLKALVTQWTDQKQLFNGNDTLTMNFTQTWLGDIWMFFLNGRILQRIYWSIVGMETAGVKYYCNDPQPSIIKRSFKGGIEQLWYCLTGKGNFNTW